MPIYNPISLPSASAAALSRLVIDRPQGSAHPRFPALIYPLDYGYLEGTSAMDGEGVDVWVGTSPVNGLDALLCVVDLPKREVEVKLLLGCTEGEKQLALQFQSQPPHMLALLVRRKETCIEVTIRDNGCGMEPELLAAIRRGEEVSTKRVSGGIGLVNVSRRMEIFYKQTELVDIASELDKGTTVTLLYPCREGEEAECTNCW